MHSYKYQTHPHKFLNSFIQLLISAMQCPHIGLVANPQKCLTNADLSNGSCPDGFYCLVHEQAAFGAGHCCPAPQLLCPAGLPDPVSSCAKGAANRCDVSTHFCNGLSLGTYNNDAIIQVCCKKPCVSDEFYNEGKCYKTKDFGQTCEIDQQCKVKNSVCKNGKSISNLLGQFEC